MKNSKMKQEKAIANFEICFGSKKTMKEKIGAYDEKISNLMNENQKLKTRAAVSFDELTPRPSFKSVMNF